MELYGRFAEVGRCGIGKGAVEDTDNIVVVFAEMIEQNGICDLAAFVGYGGGLERDKFQELVVGVDFDELGALFDCSRDSCAVSADIAEQFGKFASLKTQLSKTFMAG